MGATTSDVAATIPARLAGENHLPALYRIVEATYPEEGCGFIFETPGGALDVLATENRATFLHDKDPVSYPRDGRTYFEPNMKPWLQAVRSGQIPRLIFHSHPDTGAYFSDTDRAQAVIEDDDGRRHERHPGVVHLVVSVPGPPPRAEVARLYAFSAEQNDFVRIATYDSDGRLVEDDDA